MGPHGAGLSHLLFCAPGTTVDHAATVCRGVRKPSHSPFFFGEASYFSIPLLNLWFATTPLLETSITPKEKTGDQVVTIQERSSSRSSSCIILPWCFGIRLAPFSSIITWFLCLSRTGFKKSSRFLSEKWYKSSSLACATTVIIPKKEKHSRW